MEILLNYLRQTIIHLCRKNQVQEMKAAKAKMQVFVPQGNPGCAITIDTPQPATVVNKVIEISPKEI
ncbi:MAG: hypothetical protein FJZ87_13015 [Chloroflexi bacterium]|nr:hypothetical protein [Chloroflexota bacterium]